MVGDDVGDDRPNGSADPEEERMSPSVYREEHRLQVSSPKAWSESPVYAYELLRMYHTLSLPERMVLAELESSGVAWERRQHVTKKTTIVHWRADVPILGCA